MNLTFVLIAGGVGVFFLLLSLFLLTVLRKKEQKRGKESGGAAIEYTKINEDGSTHTHLIGSTAYGKGHVPPGGHKPARVVETVRSTSSSRDEGGDFALSAAIGAATDNAALGYLVGGSLSGALIGDALAGAASDTTTAFDSSPTDTDVGGSDSFDSSSGSDW